MSFQVFVQRREIFSMTCGVRLAIIENQIAFRITGHNEHSTTIVFKPRQDLLLFIALGQAT